MSHQPKPESSYASTRLTPRNYTGGHLLSTFNKDENDNNGLGKSPKTEKGREPRIDEAPIGSSEEEEEEEEEEGEQDIDISDNDGGVKVVEKQKLDDKFAGNDTPAPRRSGRGVPSSTQKNEGSSEPSSSQEKHRARPSSALDDADDKQDSFELWSSSRHSKRKKMTQFKSRKRSFNKATFSSAYSSSAPSELLSSTPGTKSVSGSQKRKKVGKSPKEKKSSFQMPREINLSSPPPEASTNGKTAKSAFKNPPPLPSDITISLEEAVEALSQDDTSSLSSIANSPSPPSSTFNFELSQADDSFAVKEDDQETWQSKPALCPLCKEEVDPEALMKFEAQSRQLFRDHVVFCDSHKASTAEKEWKSKGYPIIDWDTFDERIRSHFDCLEKFLVPGSSSHYRSLLDSDMKAGKAKNFRLTFSGGGLENISCGYYGTRGSGKMLQAVTTHFAQKLRRLAAIDHIVKTAGVAGYAQAVLVPELAVRLVKEDMNVNDESARHILRDSISIGEKLNAQLNDAVPVPKDSEEENQENREITAV